MVKKTSKRHQKLYKMKGCSKRKNSRKHTRKHLGGSRLMPGTFNINGANPIIPNTGPPSVNTNTTTTNHGGMLRGGCGGTCSATPPLMTGGNCGCGQLPIMSAGGRRKRGGCGPLCLLALGGAKQKGGNTWAPQGLIGKPWTPNPEGWPGVNGSRNYLDYNSYKADPQTAMINVGPNPPFLGGRKKSRGSRKQKGGNFSNFIGQDLINLGRQFQYNLGSAYNGINGYPRPVNPMPFEGQMPRTPTFSAVVGATL
jgi:hypothetical protein